MKKVRIMLAVIALLAVAGGTMAFNTKFFSRFCTIAPQNGTCVVNEDPLPCNTQQQYLGSITENSAALQYCTYHLAALENCTSQKSCGGTPVRLTIVE